jgi:hypothetical protein
MPGSPWGTVLSATGVLSRDEIAPRCQMTPHDVEAALAGYVEAGQVRRIAAPGRGDVYFHHIQARLHGADR